MSTSAFGDGLDLSNLDGITPKEAESFRSFYDRVKGGTLPAHEFLLEFRPDLLKRHRVIAREMTDLENEKYPVVHTLAHLHYYVVVGFKTGIKYETWQARAGGATRSDVLDTLGIAYLHAGPMGFDSVAASITDYLREWTESPARQHFPDHWRSDPAAFRSGLDFGTPEVKDGEMDMLRAWYLEKLGEVPGYVDLLMRNRPRVLKSYRNRMENAIRDSLPKQGFPYFQLHLAVSRCWRPGIREAILLARAFGVKKSEVLDAISWALYYGGPAGLTAVQEEAGQLLDTY